MSCVSVDDIVEVCGPNPGGMRKKLYVVRQKDLTTIPAPGVDGITIATDITPVATKGFAVWDFAQNTGELKIETEGEMGFTSLKASITFSVPRNSPVVKKVLSNALNIPLVVIVVNADDSMQILGDLNNGCYLTYQYGSGKKGGDPNMTNCTLMVDGLQEEPFFYTGEVPLP